MFVKSNKTITLTDYSDYSLILSNFHAATLEKKGTNVHKTLHKREMRLHLLQDLMNKPKQLNISQTKSLSLLKCLNYTTTIHPF